MTAAVGAAPPARSSEDADLLRALADAGVVTGSDADWSVRRLSGGHSHVTWLVTGPAARWVVKVAQPDGPLAPYDVEHEAAQMRLARAGGVPVPRVEAVVPSSSLGAPFFVMEHIAGEAPGPERIDTWLHERGAEGAAVMRALLEVLDTMARIGGERAPDLDLPALYRRHVTGLADALAEATRGTMPFPESVLLARDALVRHAEVLAAPAALVHGDFRPGNVIISDSRVPRVHAVLDWERGMWGHPLHDLGYLRLPSMRRAGKVAGLVDDRTLETLWREVKGTDLDRRALGYLTILAIFTELCGCLRALLNMGGRLSLLRVLPLIARHEHDLVTMLRRWLDGGVV